MSTSAKSKFAGFLRGLIGRTDDRAPARPVASAAPAPTSVPAPKPASTLTPAPAASAFAAPSPAGPDEIELPLAPVLAGLPMDLRAKLMITPAAGQTICLRADQVITQLAFGAVKITFGELRHLAPGIFVNSGGDLDSKLISLPLQEILPRLNPAMLSRRTARQVEVADEIVGPFSERGRGFSFTTQPLKAAPAPASIPTPAPAPVSTPIPAAPIPFTPPVARQVSPTKISPAITRQVPPRSVTPAAPTAPAADDFSQPLPISPFTPPRPAAPVTPTPTAGMGTRGNGNGTGHGLPQPPALRMRAETPAATPAPAPAATPAPAPAPAMTGPTIFAPLGDLFENWPDSLKAEILRSSLASANVPLNGSIVFPGLKCGRLAMPWKQIRQLAQPSSAPSPHDNVELELPLKVIAPLFFAAQKNPARPQARPAVSPEIPQLFFGFPQGVSAAPIAPAAPVAPAATPFVQPLPKPSPDRQDTNFYVWGENGEAPMTDEAGLSGRAVLPQTDFMNRQTHPRDAVERAVSLPGVAGAVVAMQDGLRVASQVPPELNADTLAAFLPQIFERVNQSTRELRMGTLNNIKFTVGNVPWKIFRVSAVYFAAFGRAGQRLPSAQLAQLAAELDRKKL